MKVKSIRSFGESVVFQMENGETYSMAEIEKHIAEMRKPQVKVGDWVEMDYKGKLYYRQVLSVHDNGIRVEFAGATPLLSLDGKNNMVSMRLVRILQPSEVKVSLTLSGTVEKREGNRNAFNLVDGITNSAIHYDMLTPADAELVRELTGGGE